MTEIKKIIEIKDLSIKYSIGKELYPAVKGISLELRPGEVLALVGESGSGKSTTALAIPGLLAKNALVEGSIKFGEAELVGLSEKELNSYRGEKIAVIFQEPMTALNPVYTIGWQIIEAIRAHKKVSKKEAKNRAIELLGLVEMPDPKKKFNSYPHQLSGGQRQRAMIAQALASDAKLLIADEPTTALDVTVQAEILNLLRNLQKKLDLSIIIITHDLGVVADIADYVMVLKTGEVVETGKVNEIFYHPKHAYTKQLLAAVPKFDETKVGVTTAKKTLVTPTLEFKDTSVIYNAGKANEFKVVSEVSFSVLPGEVVGLVGESGSGKSTLSKTVVGLLPLSSGELRIKGEDVSHYSNRKWGEVRKNIGVVFQDPGSSLNPRWPIGQAIAEPLTVVRDQFSKNEIQDRVKKLLDAVELPSSMINRYPHELSGGQRQRVGIARALSSNPSLLVADEPTSALDVSVQAKVLEIFKKLQKEFGFACLFITHDLAVVEMISDKVAVLNRGKLAEFGDALQVLNNPRNEYTKRLINAIPIPDPIEQEKRRTNREA